MDYTRAARSVTLATPHISASPSHGTHHPIALRHKLLMSGRGPQVTGL